VSDMSAAVHAPAVAVQNKPAKDKNLPLAHKLVVGGAAGIVGTTAIFPIGRSMLAPCLRHSRFLVASCARCFLLPDADMVKTRSQSSSKLYNGPFHAARVIFAKEGIAGFYRGAWPRCRMCALRRKQCGG
jgi:hypothetical protein